MLLCQWSQLNISHFPAGSIVQIFSADVVTSFMDPILKNLKVFFLSTLDLASLLHELCYFSIISVLTSHILMR
jgi:hypothetical protein